MKTKNLALLSLMIFSTSPLVLAQSYSGSVSELNTIFEPPMDISESICITGGDANAKASCQTGVAAARIMAEKYAQNAGKYLGCLDGYYQGIHDGYISGSNPTPDMLRDADAYVKGANFQSAGSRGLDLAKREGTTESADQIIQRYRAVVGLNQLPDKSYNYPKITFNGFDDGYENDVLKGSDFKAVEDLKWVTSTSPYMDRLAARRINQYARENTGSSCEQATIFGRNNVQQVSLWDFFRAHRQYNFESYGWRNADWAWDVYENVENTVAQYQTYKNIENLKETITTSVNDYKTEARIKKDPVTGANILDASGQPVIETYQVMIGSHIVTKEVPLSADKVKTLKNFHIQGFKEAYSRYYAKQYVSKSYNSEGLQKYKDAVIIGRLIGQDVAANIARRESYNKLYKVQSAAKYAETVKLIYTESFNKLIKIFENNPVIELNEIALFGDQSADQIFTAGEGLLAQFKVTNLGEVAKPSTISLENTSDVLAGAPFVFVAPALEQSQLVSSVLGTTTNKAEARSTIKVGLSIKNPGDLDTVAKSLVVRKEQNILINDFIEIDGVNAQLNYLTGELNVLVDIVNPAEISTPLISTLEISVNGQITSKEILSLGKREKRSGVLVQAQKLDPLSLIQNAGISGKVMSKISGKVAHQSTFSASVTVNTNQALVNYFNALATRKSLNTGNESKEERIAKLADKFEASIGNSIRNDNISWEKETGKTILAAIQRIYNESKAAKLIDNSAQADFDTIATAMGRQKSEIRAGGFLKSPKKNRNNFVNELKRISPNYRD
jgi:hypothetical protein